VIDKHHKKVSKIPQPTQSKQFDAFKNLLGDSGQLSNLIDLWDQIPKYHTPSNVKEHWKETGEIIVYSSQIELDGDVIDIDVEPALIKDSDGSGKASPFYPGTDEEILEHVLRKLLLEQTLGIHTAKPLSTWVKFNYRILRRELKKIGKTRSHTQIRQSLEIMSSSTVTIKRNGRKVNKMGILANWIDQQAEFDNPALSHLEGYQDSDVFTAVRFSDMLSRGIQSGEISQYDYATGASLNNQLARWIMRRISIKFTNAGLDRNLKAISYDLALDTVENESLLLSGIKEDKNKRKKVKNAIAHLVKKGVLYYNVDPITHKPEGNESIVYEADGMTIHNVVYHLFASRDFITKMKAANKRRKVLKDSN